MGMAEQFAADASQAGYRPSAAVAPTSLAEQFKADASSNPVGNQASRDVNASNDAKGALGRIGDLVYGGAMGAAGLVEKPAQLVLNGAAQLSGDGVASRYVKDKAAQFNKFLHDQEAQYQADTPDSAAAGIGRVGAATVPFLFGGAAAEAPQAVGAIQKIAQALKSTGITAAKGGGYAGITQPVTNVQQTGDSNNFFPEVAKQIGFGAASSLAGKAIGDKVASVIRPNTNPEVRALIDQGITPTTGQILGGGFARTEEKLTSVPILGDLIKNSQRRSIEDFNRATYGRALDPIGLKPSGEIGRAGVADVKAKLGNAYDDLLPNLQFKADPQFSSEINNLTSMIQNGNVPPKIADQFNSIVKNEVFSRMTKQGSMDGQSFKELETKLGLEIKRFGQSQDPNDRALADGLGEVLQSARGVLSRTNPQYAEQLANINQGYANYARIRGAASSLGATDGIFTPAQLQNAVKAGDKSAGKGNFATGTALMQDLSESAKNVLGSKYPDSGTIGRALMSSAPAAAGAAYLNPALAAGVGIGGTLAAAPYTAMGQKLAAALLTKRPAVAEPIANAVRAGAPLAGAAISPALLQMLKNYTN